jgi:hypothetical protein
MKPIYIRLPLAGLLLTACGFANAQAKACLLEGTHKLAGQTLVISDCLENKGTPQARFTETCQGLSEFTLGDQTFKAKLTYLPACPPAPQAVCEGLFGQRLNAHYYKRDARALEDTRNSCLAQGSKWR